MTKETLLAFIDKAQRNYKYTPDMARRLKRAVELFAEVMNDEEEKSVTVFEANLDDMLSRLDTKYHKGEFTASSLMTYRSRVQRVISEYERYGTDAKSMTAWSTKNGRKTESSKKTVVKKVALPQQPPEVKTGSITPVDYPEVAAYDTEEIKLPLTKGRTVTVSYPLDLNSGEAEKIGAVLKSIAALKE